MDLDEVADELYDVPPEEFVALRKARQDDARADGDRALAADIGALAKPSVAAWVCNLLVRAHREEIGGLVELGELLREAQQNLAGEQLRALNTQRSQLIAALSRQAASLARARGRAVGSAVSGQVEDTLRAALADPEAAEALLTGRLTAPMSYSGGLGTTRRPDLRLVRSPRPEPGPARERATSPRPTSADERRAARQRAQEEAQRAAEERRRRALEEARQAADEAIRNADEAREAAAEERRRVDELDQQRAELQARVATLSDELAEAERAAADAAARLKSAERRRKAADHEAADSEAARDRAVAHAEELAAE